MVQWEIGRILGPARGKDGLARAEALREAVSALIRVPPGPERAYVKQWLWDQLLLIAEEGGGSVADRRALETELLQALDIELRRTGGGGARTREGASSQEGGPASESVSPQSAPGRIQLAVLAAFVQYGELAVRYGTELEAADFATEEQQSVFRAIGRLVEREEPVTAAALLAEIEPEARGLLAQLAVATVPERSEDDVQRSIRRLLEDRLRRQETMLKKHQEEAGSPEEEAAIERELFDRRRRRKELGGERIVGGE
jgi:hypothetical protein